MSERVVVWISGGSSGIGAALVETTPFESARIVNIARRPNPKAEHLEADLLLRDDWDRVGEQFREVLEAGVDRAYFLHCAGSVQGTGMIVTVTDTDAYVDGLTLNAVAGPVLGRAFLAAAVATGTPATLMMCSSPGSTAVLPGMATYGAAKAGVEQWSRIAAAEMGEGPGAPRVFIAVPRAVDGEMLRETMDRSPEEIPLAGWFKAAAEEGALVPAKVAAEELWSAIEGGVEQGAIVRVGLKDEVAQSLVDEQKRFEAR
jgi:NAD(P)-dependent dehydrogenase (short-subunit alcohol dehydrogenase family)